MTCSKEFNSPHNLLLTDRPVSNLRKTVVKNYWELQVLKKLNIGRLLGPLKKVELPLMTNVLIHFTKTLLITLGWTATVSAAELGIYKNY